MAATAHATASPHAHGHGHDALNPLPQLPEIPAKRYFAIGEVAELCGVRPHVLRYWEQEFPQLKPVKRRGNRRYYLREDIEMVRAIRRLLHEQGFTITGARQQLSQQLALAHAQAQALQAARRAPRGLGRPGSRAGNDASATPAVLRAPLPPVAAPDGTGGLGEGLDAELDGQGPALTGRQREIKSLVDDLEGFLDRLDLD